MSRLASILFMLFAFLLGAVGSASGAYNYASPEMNSGDFLLWETEASAQWQLELADPTREIGVWVYDEALGVPVHVRQNPWTFFDPLGLQTSRAHVNKPQNGGHSFLSKFKKGYSRDRREIVNVGGIPVTKGEIGDYQSEPMSVERAGEVVKDIFTVGSLSSRRSSGGSSFRVPKIPEGPTPAPVGGAPAQAGTGVKTGGVPGVLPPMTSVNNENSSPAGKTPRQQSDENAPKTTPSTLHTRGVTPAPGTRVRPDGIPDNYRISNTDTPGGTAYTNPRGKNEEIRVMQGDPSSPYPNSQAPYARQRNAGGTYLRADGTSSPLPRGGRRDGDAHIPLNQFQVR